MFVILVVSAILVYYYTCIKPFRYWHERGVDTIKPWPFVGNLGAYILRKRSIADVIDDSYKSHPNRRYVGYYSMNKPILILRDPNLIKTITIRKFETFPEHRLFISQNVDPLWDKNIFGMRGGPKWQEMREMVSPTFTGSKIKLMFGLMKECAEKYTEHFLKQESVTLDMKDFFTRFTNDVICIIALGVTCNSLKNRDNEFYQMGTELSHCIRNKMIFIIQNLSTTLTKFLKVRIISKDIEIFFKDIIEKSLTYRTNNKIIRPDLIYLLTEARNDVIYEDDDDEDPAFAVIRESKRNKSKISTNQLSVEDITAQALIFFFAGFDTSSTMMSYISYELALNPEIQEKLRDEVEEALDRSNGELTYKNIIEMKYLDMIVSETLRKWPPFLFFDRRSVKSFTINAERSEEKDLHLSEGSICFIPIYSIHRDPQHYPCPDKFDPERFSEENTHKIKPYTYFPFGAGPRSCIASRFALMKGKIIIAQLIRKFEIVPVEKTQIPIEFSKKSFVPLPDGGIWLGLKPRSTEK